jgi:hypothetical protein
LDEYLQKLVRELGEAINDSINNSEAVNDALERIRATGNDVLLVLEATIAFKEKPPELLGADSTSGDVQAEERFDNLSHEDRQFLKSLKIKFDEEP